MSESGNDTTPQGEDDPAGTAEPPDSEAATGLLILQENADQATVRELLATLSRLDFQVGAVVGGVVAVSSDRTSVQALSDYVWAAGEAQPPVEANVQVLDLVRAVVREFTWDHGAETF